MPTVRAVAGTGTLLVRTRVAGYRVMDVAGGGWSAADIATLGVSVKDAQDSLLATTTLSGGDVNDQISFVNLPIGVLTVICEARDGDGNKISVDENGLSQAVVTVTESGVTTANLTVQLGDRVEQTQNATFHGIGVTPGNLLTAGPVEISTASEPAPTPTPAPVLTDNNRVVIAAGTTPTFTLPVGTYVLKIDDVVHVGAMTTAEWTLYEADGVTGLGTYAGNYLPGGSVTIDTTGFGNVGVLTFQVPNVDPMIVVPGQDTLTISSGM